MLAWILISASSFAGQDGTLCVPNPAFPSQKVHTKTGTAASAQLEFGIKWDSCRFSGGAEHRQPAHGGCFVIPGGRENQDSAVPLLPLP